MDYASSTPAGSARDLPFGPVAGSPVSLSPKLVSGALAVADCTVVLALGVAIYLAYVGWLPEAGQRYLAASLFATIVLVQGLAIAGLYRFEVVIAPRLAVPRLLRVGGIVFLSLIAFAFALKVSDGFSRVWAFSWGATSMLALAGLRWWFSALVRKLAHEGRLTRRVAVVGAGPQARKLLEALSDAGQPWNRIVAVFDDRRTRVGGEVAGCQVSGGLDDLHQFARTTTIDELVVALPWSASERIRSIVEQLQPLPLRIRLSPDFTGLEFPSGSYGRHLGVPLLDVCERPIDGWSYVVKSAVDKLAAAVGLVVLSPLLLLIALLVRTTSRGPVLFRQHRYGYNERLISMYKFRSMYVEQQDDAAERLVTRGDARVTPVGAFLRRTSLDELPQLVNVLRGEMSLVGPRPHALKAKAAGKLYQEAVSDYAWRHKVKPGITGWAQVNGWRGETDTEEKLRKRIEHDLYYVSNWSLALDLHIVLRTFWMVLAGRNAY